MSKPKLSISLLSSGRSKTIERCLASLQVFKDAFETEIVIVDTDPDQKEEVRAVLEKYADKIVRFEWINDFSAARNAGMKECSGEWFMFVDDDEWFMDAAPLIDFLKSEESKKYHWVNIICRNYADPEFNKWGDNWVSRLVRLKKDTHFSGIVHEYFEPLVGNEKPIRAMLGHTGYIYLTEEQKKQHAHRNISLLEKAVEKRETQMRWWLQLVQEYDAIGNNVKVRETSIHCLELLQKYDNENAREMKGYFTAALMRVDRLEQRYEEEKKTWEKYGQERGFTVIADTYLDLESAILFNNLEDYDKAREYVHRYFESYEKLKDRTDEFSNISYHFLSNTFEEVLWGVAICMMVYLDIKKGDFESFEKYFDRLRWEDGAPYDFKNYARLFIAQMSSVDFDPHFVQMAEAFWKAPEVREIVLDVLMRTAGTKDASYWRIIRIFSDEAIRNPVPWDLRILQGSHEGREDFDFAM
nr:glycosyltransferase [Lachnospiraceae bacterium]